MILGLSNTVFALVAVGAVGITIVTIVVPVLATTVDECAPGPCKNGGNCTDAVFGYTCDCVVAGGWEGLTCETAAVPSVWSSWAAQTDCTTTCNLGSETYKRKCKKAPTKYGVLCTGVPEEQRECNLRPCPIDGVITWSEWTDCSATCGDGTKTKTGICVEQQHGGVACGSVLQTENCKLGNCCKLINMETHLPTCSNSGQCSDTATDFTCACVQYGGFEGKTCTTPAVASEWTAWVAAGQCSTECGDPQTNAYTRTCTAAPTEYGEQCVGSPAEDRTCNIKPCPINGTNTYGGWSDCSASCGKGMQTRTVTCVEPQHGGLPCASPVIGKACNLGACCDLVGAGSSPCRNSGTCNDLPTSYSCTCVNGTGFGGDNCGTPIVRPLWSEWVDGDCENKKWLTTFTNGWNQNLLLGPDPCGQGLFESTRNCPQTDPLSESCDQTNGNAQKSYYCDFANACGVPQSFQDFHSNLDTFEIYITATRYSVDGNMVKVYLSIEEEKPFAAGMELSWVSDPADGWSEWIIQEQGTDKWIIFAAGTATDENYKIDGSTSPLAIANKASGSFDDGSFPETKWYVHNSLYHQPYLTSYVGVDWMLTNVDTGNALNAQTDSNIDATTAPDASESNQYFLIESIPDTR